MSNNLRAAVSIICLSMAFFLLSPAQTVLAVDITVDSDCSLTDAIQSAERDSASGGCAAGDGADTIHLTHDYRLVSALPEIESDITFEGNGHSINGNGRHRIFTILWDGIVSLRNVTLRNGRADRGGAIVNRGKLQIEDSSFIGNKAFKNDGGAIMNAGRLTIANSVFADNIADRLGDITSSGGAIYHFGSEGAKGELNVSNTSFRGNWAEFVGGAIVIKGGAANISDSEFQGNSSDLSGGAIHNQGTLSIAGSDFVGNMSRWAGALSSNRGVSAIANSRFTGNTADASGGAIENSSDISVSDSHFTGNSANTSGGAIYNDNATASVSGSSFYGNSAEWGGAISSSDDISSEKAELKIMASSFSANTADYGGAVYDSGVASINGSYFTSNSAAIIGGAIASSSNELSVVNSTFSANGAEYDGAGLSLSSTVPAYLAHLTVVGNAAGQGAGIYVHQREGDEPLTTLHNSLLADNFGGDCLAAFAESGANLIADGSCEPALSGDPILGALIEPDGSPAYRPLLPDSPAIDAADPDHCTDTDQTGAPRPQGAACDIGAVEYTSE